MDVRLCRSARHLAFMGPSLILGATLLANCSEQQLTSTRLGTVTSQQGRTTTGSSGSDFGYGSDTIKLVTGQDEYVAPVSMPAIVIDSISVSPDLPVGLKLGVTGIISGIPTFASVEKEYVVKVLAATGAVYQATAKIRVNNALTMALTVNPISETEVNLAWSAPTAAIDGYRVSSLFADGTTKHVYLDANTRTLKMSELDPGTKFNTRVFALATDVTTSGNADAMSIGWTPFGAINADSVSIPPQEPWKPSGLEGATFSENFSIVWSFYWNPGFTPVWKGIPSKAQKGDFYFNTMLNKAYQNGILGGGRDDITQLWTNGVDKFMISTSRARVHMWDYLPNTPDQLAPSREIGLGSTNRSTFSGGAGVCYDVSTDRLFVSNGGRHRVLVFNGWPSTSNPDAAFVLGQPDFDTFTAATSATGMYTPTGVSCEGGILAVADFNNHRVLVWTKPITANGQAPDFIFGQSNATSGGANGGGGIGVGGLYEPLGVLVLPKAAGGYALLVVDRRNHRIVEWNTIPATPASQTFPGPYYRVYGQPNQTSNTPNADGQSLASMANPASLSYERDKNGMIKPDIFWVADGAYWATHNARTLKFQRGYTTAIDLWGDENGSTTLSGWTYPKDRTGFWWGGFNASRIGCLSPSGTFLMNGYVWKNAPADGKTPSDFTDSSRCHMTIAGGKSWIVNAVSITGYNVSSPHDVASPLPAPQIILGRKNADGTDNAAIPDSFEYKISSATDLASIGSSMLAIDSQRIVIWNTNSITNHAMVTNVIGQPGKTTNTANQGGLSAATLNGPSSMVVSNGKIFIADTGNNRVLIYNSLPSTDGAAASVILGQANGTTNTAGSDLLGMNSPGSVAVINGKLVVADIGNKRALVWNTIPTVTGTAASKAVDLRDFKFSLPSWYNPDALYPRWIGYVNGKVYVEQYGRILVMPDIF